MGVHEATLSTAPFQFLQAVVMARMFTRVVLALTLADVG